MANTERTRHFHVMSSCGYVHHTSDRYMHASTECFCFNSAIVSSSWSLQPLSLIYARTCACYMGILLFLRSGLNFSTGHSYYRHINHSQNVRKHGICRHYVMCHCNHGRPQEIFPGGADINSFRLYQQIIWTQKLTLFFSRTVD